MVDGVNLIAGRDEAVQLGAVDERQRHGDRVVRLDAEVTDHHRPRRPRLRHAHLLIGPVSKSVSYTHLTLPTILRV